MSLIGESMPTRRTNIDHPQAYLSRRERAGEAGEADAHSELLESDNALAAGGAILEKSP